MKLKYYYFILVYYFVLLLLFWFFQRSILIFIKSYELSFSSITKKSSQYSHYSTVITVQPLICYSDLYVITNYDIWTFSQKKKLLSIKTNETTIFKGITYCVSVISTSEQGHTRWVLGIDLKREKSLLIKNQRKQPFRDILENRFPLKVSKAFQIHLSRI